MSGKPYPEGVAKVLDLLAAIERLQSEAADLEPKVQQLAKVHEEHGEAQRELARLLGSMDLESQGNFGFQARMGWFLAEAKRHLAARLAAPAVRFVERATPILKAVEWVYRADHDAMACPGCYESKKDGHGPDCWLKAVIDGRA